MAMFRVGSFVRKHHLLLIGTQVSKQPRRNDRCGIWPRDNEGEDVITRHDRCPA